MSAAATAPVSASEPSRSGRLLGLVRRLIEYGKGLANTLRQHSVATDLAAVTRPFGTRDIALILARITRGLQLADALEARLVRNAARLDAAPRLPGASSIPKRASASCGLAAPPVRSPLAHLPTPEQIAAEVRRRPIGAVIADICRDLGITPSHELWREVQLAMIQHGGDFLGLFRDVMRRLFPFPVPAAAPAAAPGSSPSSQSPGCTGPP